MPNFHARNFVTPTFPARYGQSLFKAAAFSPKNDMLVLVHCQDQEFLLKVDKRKESFLIKGDKITRPSRVALLQQALRDFKDLSQAEVLNQAMDATKKREYKKSSFLKEIDYFAKEFAPKAEILVEVGFGSGRHLLHQAKKNPDKIIIGLEIHKPSIDQVLKQCELQNIENVLLVDYDARIFLEFLSSNSVAKIFVHFPVPWDKKPHRRVIAQDFIKEAQRVLKKEGSLELRTDSDNYFAYSFWEFMAFEKVKLHVNKNKDLEISSKYEDRWRRQEKDIYDITLCNQITSKTVPAIGKLAFDKALDFQKLKSSFKEVTKRGEGFFVHLEEIYTISEKEGFIRLSFGSSRRNEHNYIHIKEDSVNYLPDNVLATKDNMKAHKQIKELLYGTCD